MNTEAKRDRVEEVLGPLMTVGDFGSLVVYSRDTDLGQSCGARATS